MTASKRDASVIRADQVPHRVAHASGRSEAPVEAPVETTAKKGRARFDQMRALEAWRVVLTQRETFVFLTCWNSAPADGRSFHLSHETMAKRIRCHREDAVRAARKLQRLGLLVLVKRGNSFTHDANEYRLPTVLPPTPA